jgi:hypothetical protein
MSNHSTESWPGLSRPSTSCLPKRRKKGVDARDERGHDDGECDSIASEHGLEWAAENRSELMEDWDLCVRMQMRKKIAPLR